MNTNATEVKLSLKRRRSAPTEKVDVDFDQLTPKQKVRIETFLRKLLPDHGSIGQWYFQFEKKGLVLHSSYECVDPDGMTMKWVPFEVIVKSDFSYELEFRFEKSKPTTHPVRLCLQAELSEVFTRETAKKWVTYLGEIVSSKKPEKHCWLN